VAESHVLPFIQPGTRTGVYPPLEPSGPRQSSVRYASFHGPHGWLASQIVSCDRSWPSLPPVALYPPKAPPVLAELSCSRGLPSGSHQLLHAGRQADRQAESQRKCSESTAARPLDLRPILPNQKNDFMILLTNEELLFNLIILTPNQN
jgi:hypothetical protein